MPSVPSAPHTWGGFYNAAQDAAGLSTAGLSTVSDAAQQAAQALAASVAGYLN